MGRRHLMALSTGLALYGAGPAAARSPAEPTKSPAASLVVGDGARAHLRFDLRGVGREAGTARRRLHLHLQLRRAGSGSSLVVRRVGRARPFARVTLPRRGAVSVDVTRVVGRARVVRLVLTRSRGRAVLVGRGPRAPRLDVEPASRPRPSPTVTPTPTPQATSTPSTQPPPVATPTPSPTPTATSSPEPTRTPTPDPTATARPTPQPVVVGAAGDIACDPAAPEYNGGAGTATACHHRAISDLLLAEPQLDAVLTLGDLQYESATLEQFLASYEPTWGRVKTKTHPVPGNHEYQTPRAAGYFDYWGSLAGERTKGYYSFDLGAWHVVALNSVCWEVGGCGAGSPQEQWLRADLAASRARCTLAFWHHPRFASGSHGDDPMTHALWAALHEEGAELVLSGHDHNYERLAPVNPQGLPDPEAGIRSFVVGTGGKSLRAAGGVPNPASEVFDSSAYGYLRLSLGATGYDWRFVSEPGATFTDSGSGSCH